VRTLTLVLVGLTALSLGGCARSRLDATSNTNWTVRDRELLAITPYAQASIPEAYRRHLVDYHRKEAPGTIVVEIGTSTTSFPKAKPFGTESQLARERSPGRGSPKLGVCRSGQRGCQPRKSSVGLAIFRITSAPGHTIQWGRGLSTFMTAVRTRCTGFTALISRNTSAMPSRQAASV
jgi:hypothetical protein